MLSETFIFKAEKGKCNAQVLEFPKFVVQFVRAGSSCRGLAEGAALKISEQ